MNKKVQFLGITVCTIEESKERIDYNIFTPSCKKDKMTDFTLNEGGYPIIRHFLSRKTSCVLFGPTSKDFFGFDENINISANTCPGCEWLFKTWYRKCMISKNHAFCMKSLQPEMVADCIEKECVLK